MLVNCTEDSTTEPDVVEPDPEETQDKGLYSVKDSYMEIDNYGGEISITFLSLGDWTAESNSDWCTLEASSGASGDVKFIINVAPNADLAEDAERKAMITISIEGYMNDLDLCEVRQAADVENPYTSGADPNVWISEYMTRNYLWNDEFIKAKPLLNYWTDSDTFFNTALSRMENIDEDGNYYSSGERYFYSTLTTYAYSSSYAPATKAMDVATDFGIRMVYPVAATTSSYYFLIASVVEDSPADKAGLRRGMYITSYDKTTITGSNLETYYNTLMGYVENTSSAVFSISEYQLQGTQYALTALGDYSVTPGSYTSNPIIFKGIFQNSEADKTVGYMVYNDFEMAADDYLIEVFENIKSYNPNEFILDLRYNGGGDVYSSAVMASAIVGSKYQGQTYCHMQYNDYRTALGNVDYFYIGQSPSMVEYPQIEEALSTSLNLDRVYVIVTGFTASASELIINGLRGLGVEVILIGQTTEGKNVGMEVTYSAYDEYSQYDFGQYLYELMPITFYGLNAQGFKDYSNGFDVDLYHVETDYIMSDWGDSDYCVYAALRHIYYGEWPSMSPATSRASTTELLPVIQNVNLRPISRGSRVYSAEIIESLQ